MADGRALCVTVFIITAAAMLVVACLLVGLGFAFGFGEAREPPSTAVTPSWAKYVCWAVAALTGLAAIPVGLVAARLTRPGRK